MTFRQDDADANGGNLLLEKGNILLKFDGTGTRDCLPGIFIPGKQSREDTGPSGECQRSVERPDQIVGMLQAYREPDQVGSETA
jgi:hypothetical protein